MIIDETEMLRLSSPEYCFLQRLLSSETGQQAGFDPADGIKDSYGLGLSVVKAIQTVMGQRFVAENVQDGVIFWFEARRFRER